MVKLLVRTRDSRLFESTRLDIRIAIRTFSLENYVAAWEAHQSIGEGMLSSRALLEAADRHKTRVEDVSRAMTQLNRKTGFRFRRFAVRYKEKEGNDVPSEKFPAALAQPA